MSVIFPAEASARRTRDRVLALLFAILCVVLVARAARKQGGVLELNRAFGARFLAHEDPWYDPERGHRVHGPYPPSLSIVAAPLSLLPPTAARVVWASMQMLALWVLLRLLRKRAERSFPEVAEHAPVAFALALLLASRFLLRDTAGGGGNLLYASLAYFGLELAFTGHAWMAGAPLGLALALKPNLAPLVLFFAMRKRWSACASSLVFALAFFALPGLYFGPSAYASLAQRWVRDVASYASLEDLHDSAQVPEGLPVAEEGMNQSLREAVFRLLRPPGDTGAADVSVVDVSPGTAIWISRALSIALLASVLIVAARARNERSAWLAAMAFFPLALLLSPITWKAHHAALIPVFFGLACCALERDPRPRWLAALLVVYWLVCDLASEEIVGARFRDQLQAVSVVTWMDIVLIGALLHLATTRRPLRRHRGLRTIEP